jgi:hypothetical protein
VLAIGPGVKTLEINRFTYRPNGVLVGLLINLKNVGIQRISIGPTLAGETWVVVDSLGRRYKSEGFYYDARTSYTQVAGWPEPKEGDRGVNYEPGHSRTMVLLFDLIEGASDLSLEFKPDFYDHGVAIVDLE